MVWFLLPTTLHHNNDEQEKRELGCFFVTCPMQNLGRRGEPFLCLNRWCPKKKFFSFFPSSFVRSLSASLGSPGLVSQLNTTSINLDVVVMCISITQKKKEKKKKKESRRGGKRKKERNKGNIKNKTNELLGMSDFILLLFWFFCFLNHFPSYYYSVCSIHGYQLSFPFLLGHVVDILLILFIFI